MTPSEEHLFKAVQLNALAEDEADATMRSQLKRLSDCYLRLAAQADRNGRRTSDDFPAQA